MTGTEIVGMIVGIIFWLFVICVIVPLLIKRSRKKRQEFEQYKQQIQNLPEWTQQGHNIKPSFAQDAPSIGFAILGFLFPFVGLIMYVSWINTLPFRARSAGKGALAGVIVYFIGIVVSVIITIVLLGGV